MRYLIALLTILFFTNGQLLAQDNVAEIAHAFIKTIKSNDINHIQNRFLNVDASYAVLPKESAGLSAKEKNDVYLKPMYEKFAENLNQIEAQISESNIDVKKIDLVSYKLEKKENPKLSKPQAMSLFVTYQKKEYLLPISVIEIDEHWYILEILLVKDLFKKAED